MAKSKNKRARTISVRQDYRKGGKVEREQKFTGGSPVRSGQLSRFRNLAREGQAQIDELNQPAQPEPTFGAVPKGAKTGRPDVGMEPAPSQPVEVPTDEAAPVASPTPAAQPVVPTQPVVPISQPDLSGTPRFGDFGAFGDYDRDQPPRNGEPEPDPGGGTPTPTPAPTPAPTPSPEPTPTPTPSPSEGRKLAEDILSGDFQAPQIPAVEEVPIGEDIPAYKIEQDFGIPMSEVATLPQPSQEQIQEIENIQKAGDPVEVQVKKILDVTTLPEDVAIKVATGELSPKAIAQQINIARVGEIKAAEVEIEEGALAKRVVGVLSPKAKADAAKNAGLTLSRLTRAKKQLRNAGLSEEDITELGNEPEALEDRLTDFTEAQRGIIEGLPEEALVSNQLNTLLDGLESGEIPVWAKPAVASVEKMLAERGMSASTVGRDTLINTIIQSSIPLAQANAQAIQQSVSQQKSIEAQAFEADAQREQQAALQRANVVFQMDMAQFSADQQTELANSKFLQTVSLTEASNRQQAVVQNAVLMSQANIAEANLFQQAQISNAKNFLAMDMANLSNTQQSFMLEAQQEQQRMLSNQGALNAAEQFNAASEMQVEQFNSNLASNIDKFNATQINSAKQFNAAAQNSAEARRVANEMEVAKSNAIIVNDINKYNSQVAFERDRFNVANQQAITQSNFEWRRKANLANTAVQNQINMQNAMNAYNLNTASLSFIWQEQRDNADRQWRHEENELNRKNALIQQAIDNASAIGKHYSSYSNIVDMIGDIFD